MTTPAPPQPDKADLDEAVAWLRILWKVPISNEDLEDFFAWSRRKPAARAVYDDLSRRVHAAMMAEPSSPPPRPSPS